MTEIKRIISPIATHSTPAQKNLGYLVAPKRLFKGYVRPSVMLLLFGLLGDVDVDPALFLGSGPGRG